MKKNNIYIKTKQIICIMAILILCNFIIPNYTYAVTDTDGGGKLFDPIIKFTTFLCDSTMQFLQTNFIKAESIDNGDGTYKFQYSPAVIFSGDVLAFDIDFINPNPQKASDYGEFCKYKMEEYRADVSQNGITITWEDFAQKMNDVKNINGVEKIDGPDFSNESSGYEDWSCVYYYNDETNLYVEYFWYTMDNDINDENCYYKAYTYNANDELIVYQSTASTLQNTIATWYNALRRIALVGLLSVLVYTGIRIVLSSSSAEGNSKYKKMLTDWLIALCLLFTLHYIMSATLIITKNITNIFDVGQSDELLNTLRQTINQSKTWKEVLAEVVMYIVLVIFTITFTFQYLKRVLYMAFFTMIAPLITLTYPLDKISDGKAQAFNMWMKEYIFNALIQVVHLVLYYALIETAIELVKIFPLYGIIAIGFMTQGEKIIRSMFGFNNAETVSSLGAAATGGLITTAMNKLKTMPTGASKQAKSSSSGEKSNSNNVRTATNNPLIPLQGKGGATGGTNSGRGLGREVTQTQGDSQAKVNGEQAKDNFGGAKAILDKYGKPAASVAIGTLTGGAAAMIGFATGVSQGDAGAAISGALAGGAAGKTIGEGTVNFAANAPEKIKNKVTEARNTWQDGIYGKEQAEAIRFDKEFREGSTYKALQSHEKFSDENIQAMLNEGITDKKAMTQILDNSGVGIQEAIKYYKASKDCPDEIYYDEDKFKLFCDRLVKKDSSLDRAKIEEMIEKFK